MGLLSLISLVLFLSYLPVQNAKNDGEQWMSSPDSTMNKSGDINTSLILSPSQQHNIIMSDAHSRIERFADR